MCYTKIITYNDIVEIYEYERESMVTRRFARDRGQFEIDSSSSDLVASREDSLSARKMGKRQTNANRSRLDFKRLVGANLGGSSKPVLFTFTFRENVTDLSYAYQCLTSFIKSLRKRFGNSFRYIAVPEFQKRGAVHFHAFFWSLPEELVLSERNTRFFARLWGHGFVDVHLTDGSDKLSSYLAKYMSKAFLDPRLCNKKAYVGSRNLIRPYVISGAFSVNTFFHSEDLDFDLSTALLYFDREYDTMFLGKGRYRLYKIKK